MQVPYHVNDLEQFIGMNQGGYPWAFVYVNGHFELIQVPVLGTMSAPARAAPAKPQYATGRWTREEHEQFLVGLKLHGRVWKNIAPLVKTRSTVQIRTHAQKYFLSLQKPATDASQDSSAATLSGEKRTRDGDCGGLDEDIFNPKRTKAAADGEDDSDADSTDCSSTSGSDSEGNHGDATKASEHLVDVDFDQCWDAFEFIAGSETKCPSAV
jgi:SHAQKYF class myb-like DNA-binding protein